MFSVAGFTRSERPCPPTPTAATLKRSLGAVCPRPSTCRGTIAKPAPVSATSETKSRRVILFDMTLSEPSALAPPSGGRPADAFALRRQLPLLRQRANPDIPEREHAGVIALQADVPALGAAELRPRVELRRCDLGFPVGAPQLALDDFDVVQP